MGPHWEYGEPLGKSVEPHGECVEALVVCGKPFRECGESLGEYGGPVRNMLLNIMWFQLLSYQSINKLSIKLSSCLI